jgi:hypothetical protein
VPVLVRPPFRGTRRPILIEPFRDCPVTVALQVLDEDPLHHSSRLIVDLQHAQPEPLDRL